MEPYSLTLDEACQFLKISWSTIAVIERIFIAWFAGSIPYSEIALMQHELQPDSLVDLKFIMADTGFGKTFIYDRIKSGDLPKAKVIHGRARWLYRDHCEFKNKLLSRANG